MYVSFITQYNPQAHFPHNYEKQMTKTSENTPPVGENETKKLAYKCKKNIAHLKTR